MSSFQRRRNHPLNWLLVTVNYLVNQDLDNPCEHTDEKGDAFAEVYLSFAFRFDRIFPVLPLERFEGNEVGIEALLEFRGTWILNECDGMLAGFGDVGGWIGFASETF